MISVSIVSHNHGPMLAPLVNQLINFSEIDKVILTINVPEITNLPISPKLVFVVNEAPKGFSANHNAAFLLTNSPYFCVLNPDIEFLENPFQFLVSTLKDHDSSIVAPQIINKSGYIEDNCRYFPNFYKLFLKFLRINKGVYAYEENKEVLVDWVAGMFMLFNSRSYSLLAGFDEGYYLYYEDVDICHRASLKKMSVFINFEVKVIHHAQRSSHKNLRFLIWHLKSMSRYLYFRGAQKTISVLNF